MERRFKKNGGITLVALIITIIIMLILVAVSVNVIVKSNLIGTAEKAASGYKTAQEKESNLAGITINGKPIESYLPIEEHHNWQYTDETRGAIRCTCAECKAFNDGDTEGRTIAIGAQIGEAETINGSVTVTAAETGYDTDQTITASGTVRWVVLGYEDQNNNGTNETLLLTTDTVIGDELYLKGAAAYNNAIDTKEKDGVITKVCKGLFGTKARSMKIEDVNRAMGYDETPKGMQYDHGKSTWSTIDTTKNKKLKNFQYWTTIQNTLYMAHGPGSTFYTPEYPNGIPAGTEETNLGEYEIDGYVYILTENTNGIPTISSNISAVAKTLIFREDNKSYWLASREVRVVIGGGTAVAYFAIKNVEKTPDWISTTCGAMLDCCGSVHFDFLPVRPVVSLTSEIPAVEEAV